METASSWDSFLGFLAATVQARQGAPNHIGMIQLLGDLDLTLKPPVAGSCCVLWDLKPCAAMGHLTLLHWFSHQNTG